MSGLIRSYIRGKLVDHIDFDSNFPSSTAGGYGDVFRGTLILEVYPDGSPRRYCYVALKSMRCGTDDDDNRLSRIIEEAFVWKDLHHPNVLRFLGLLTDTRGTYLVSPFAAHGSLPQYLVQNPDADRPQFLGQIATGLTYLHDQDIVHGDVKGANVLIFDGPHARICDFGLSKYAQPYPGTTQNQLGSFNWMSPERMFGQTRTLASDVYAFGMTIFEVLSGSVPFAGLDFVALIQAVHINHERPPVQPESSAAGLSYAVFWILAGSCWGHLPEGRPTMGEARDTILAKIGALAVDATLEDLPVVFGPSPPRDDVTRKRRRSDCRPESSRGSGAANTGTRSEVSPLLTLETARDIRLGSEAKRARLLGNDTGEEIPAHVARPTSTENVTDDFRPKIKLRTYPRVDGLPRAKSASHRSARPNAPSPCLEGTRTAVLEKVYEWAKDTDPETPRVFWLNGMAGTGKSTIAQTLAVHAEQEEILGASFFFSRHGDAEVRNASRVISTLAFQFAQSVPTFIQHLDAVLANDPDAAHYTIPLQVQLLLAEPLQAIERSKPLLIVLDALDECEGPEATEVLQLLLPMLSQRTIPAALKIFIACRPDHDLDIALQSGEKHQKFLLHDVKEDIVQADIELYLRDGLTNPPPYPLPSEWVSNADLKELVRRSGKLFVYATTILRFIRCGGLALPQNQLQALLRSTFRTGENPLADLDDLYLQLLKSAINPRATTLSNHAIRHTSSRIQTILGALVFLRAPLPLCGLAELLAVPLDQMVLELQLLHSVIVVPKSVDDAPRFLHQSFPDFIVNPTRCSNHHFLVQATEHERHLAIQSLGIMINAFQVTFTASRLSRISEARGVSDAKEPVIAPALAYSSCFWAAHLQRVPPGDATLVEQLQQFTSKCLMRWLEVLSLTRQVAAAARAADVAYKWVVLSKGPDQTIALLHDVHRFVLAHLRCISEGPHQVYISAFPFVPRNTTLWKQYQHNVSSPIHVISGVEPDWLPCLGVLTGHSSDVMKVTFSPSGSRIASCSNDHTVRIWDAVSGQPITTLKGHYGPVNVISFSPDGSRIASGSSDRTVRTWDATSGLPTATLNGHSSNATLIAFSHDSSRITSCSKNGEVRTWSVISGQHIATLESHSKPVTITLSPGGSHIAFATRDHTVCIKDCITARPIAALKGHSGSVNIISFSLDGSRIASSSSDRTVRTWDVISGLHIATLKGHSARVTIIAFSPDCSRVASCSKYGSVRTWNAVSGQPIAILEAYSNSVNTIAFSLDGSRIASGSRDQTVRIWDGVSGQPMATLKGHSGAVNAIAFSPDGSRIASGSSDCTVRIWDSVLGQHMRTTGGHSDSINTLAFSPDGSHIASGSKDGTVRTWNAATGHLITTLEGYSWVIAFSPNGSHIASGSGDHAVRVWDTISGRPIATLKGHHARVNVIVFSPDGSRIASSSKDGTVHIWDPASAQPIATLMGYSWAVTTITFSFDNSRVASCSIYGAVRTWDAVSGQPIATLAGYSDSVNAVTFSPDGFRLASVSNNSRIHLWDALSGQLITTLRGYFKSVETVFFSPEGSRILVRFGGGHMCSWDYAAGDGGAALSFEAGPLHPGPTVQTPSAPWCYNAVMPFKSLARNGDALSVIREWSNMPFFRMCASDMRCTAVSPDGSAAVAGCTNGRIFIFLRPNGRSSHTS